MTHAAIRNALESRLAAMGLPAASIAWPGVKFPAVEGQAFPDLWYKPAILPGAVDAALGVGASTHPHGDFQVSVFYNAALMTGTSALFAAADALVAQFDRARLGSLQCGVPKIGPLMPEPDWLHLPVTVPYLVT